MKEAKAEAEAGARGRAGAAGARLQVRSPTAVYTFELNRALVEEARQEVGDGEIARSIEAALIAALDYCRWVREVQRGERDVRE